MKERRNDTHSTGFYSPVPCNFLFFLVEEIYNISIFSTKVLTWDTFLASPTEEGTGISRGHPKGPAVYRAIWQRQYLHISVYLSMGRAKGIEPATSRSVVKRSIDRATTVA